MSDVSLLVDGLKRELAVPGEFAATYPNTTDDDLVGALMDGFAGAQLDGFFSDMVLSVDDETITPDLSTAGGAIVIAYATERVLMSKLRDLNTRVTYEAGPVKYEIEKSAAALTEQVKWLRQRRLDLLAQAMRAARRGQSVYMTDQYLTRSLATGDYFPYELAGLG